MRGTPIALAAAIAATGCVGSRSYVAADSARYPISMSSAVRGPDGVVLGPDQLVSKGELAIDYMTCRMLWTLLPLKPLFGTEDISDDLNRAIAEKGGEAVINLSVTSGATVWSVMTLIGVLPDCGKVKIRGDVVARKVMPAPAPAAAPAPIAPTPTPPEPAPITPNPEPVPGIAPPGR